MYYELSGVATANQLENGNTLQFKRNKLHATQRMEIRAIALGTQRIIQL